MLFRLKLSVIIINYRHEEISATTPNVLSSQYPRVPSNMLPPPVDLLQSRTFLLDLQVLSQANSAYDNPSNYEYQRASQMILIAVCINSKKFHSFNFLHITSLFHSILFE